MAVNLSWYEPPAVKRDRLAKTDPWYPNRVNNALGFGVGLAVAWGAFDAVVRAFGGRGAVNYWSGMLFVTVGGGAIYGLLRPWLASFVASPIVVSRRGINRNSVFPASVLRTEFWPWESIGELVVERSAAGNEVFRVLVAYDPQGKVLATFGVAPDVTAARIATAVAQFRSEARVFDRT